MASGIGNLANDSAAATTEIGNIIKDITEQIKTLSRCSESSMSDITTSSQAVSLLFARLYFRGSYCCVILYKVITSFGGIVKDAAVRAHESFIS